VNNNKAFFDEHRMEMIRMVIEPRLDDIYLVTYPRSGTTWLQMILYQMMTRGEMSFAHISQVIPFFDRALLSRTNFAALPSPRVFKTHLSFQNISTLAGRYIYVARSGKDVLTSYYHFHKSHYNFDQGLGEFFEDFVAGRVPYGSWFDHVSEWRKHASHPGTLFLLYEDLVNNLESCIRLIANFCEFVIPEAKYPIILERCSFRFMKQYESKFDHAVEVAWEEGKAIAKQATTGAFLRQGRVGDWTEHLTDDQSKRFDELALSDFLSNDSYLARLL
jgi:hypothetical protein